MAPVTSTPTHFEVVEAYDGTGYWFADWSMVNGTAALFASISTPQVAEKIANRIMLCDSVSVQFVTTAGSERGALMHSPNYNGFIAEMESTDANAFHGPYNGPWRILQPTDPFAVYDLWTEWSGNTGALIAANGRLLARASLQTASQVPVTLPVDLRSIRGWPRV